VSKGIVGRNSFLRGLVIALIFGLLCISAFAAGFMHGQSQPPQVSADERLLLVWEAWSYVERYFYGPTPESKELIYGAIDGALETLGDPYTRLVRPVAHEIEKDRLRGHFGGIGAYVYEDVAGLHLRPLPDTPAEKAGVEDGDRLLAIDSLRLPEGATVELAVSWIRGPVGTTVKIDVYRPSTQENLTFLIERAEIAQPTVEWRLLTDCEPPVGYIRIILFSERTPAEVQRALASVRRDGARSLVLDLRGNPGGLLESAIEVSSRFLERGIVVYEVLADGTERRYAVRPRVRASEPVVVLVDESTASAAEILAGALQDHGRAQLVGERTRGKGSVQLAYELSDGSSVHVTSAVWLIPNREEINGVGLVPDHAVENSEADRDLALERGLQVLGPIAKVKEASQ